MSTGEEIQAKYSLLRPYLKGRLRGLWAAAEAANLSRGGIKRVAAATGLSCACISAGLRELLTGERPLQRSTRAKRGPKFSEDKDPTLLRDLEQLLSDEVAGSPMTDQKWVRSSTRRFRDRLREMGHRVGHCTVDRLLRKLGFSLWANQKRRGGSRCPGRAIPLHRLPEEDLQRGGAAGHQRCYQADGADRGVPQPGGGLVPAGC